RWTKVVERKGKPTPGEHFAGALANTLGCAGNQCDFHERGFNPSGVCLTVGTCKPSTAMRVRFNTVNLRDTQSSRSRSWRRLFPSVASRRMEYCAISSEIWRRQMSTVSWDQ